jgi:hypothetical protein
MHPTMPCSPSACTASSVSLDPSTLGASFFGSSPEDGDGPLVPAATARRPIAARSRGAGRGEEGAHGHALLGSAAPHHRPGHDGGGASSAGKTRSSGGSVRAIVGMTHRPSRTISAADTDPCVMSGTVGTRQSFPAIPAGREIVPGHFPSSSNSQVSRPSSEESKTGPFVKEQQSRAALLLVVRCRRLAGVGAGDRIQAIAKPRAAVSTGCQVAPTGARRSCFPEVV